MHELFLSLRWKSEPYEKYTDKIITLIEKLLTCDGMGRVHLQIPNSGKSTVHLRAQRSVHLRAQRFNPTTAVTHATDT